MILCSEGVGQQLHKHIACFCVYSVVEEEERALGLSGRCADMLTLMACRVCDPEVCVCACARLCVYVCVCVCMCLYVYIRMSGCECVYVRSVCWVCADRR